MKVSDVMIRDVVACTPDSSLHDVIRLMSERDIGFIPVISAGDKLAGVITDRDACMAAYQEDKPLSQIPVHGAMSTWIAACRPEAEIEEAERMMREYQVRRLPVTTSEGKLVGIISLNDLARLASAHADEEFEEEVAVTLGAIAEPREPEGAAEVC